MSSPVILRIGIAPVEDQRARAQALVTCTLARGPEDPTLWFSSMTQLQRVFSDENCALLKAIRTLRPTSVDELAAAVGKKQSSVSRALHLMAPYGVVQLVRHGREVTPQVAFDQIVVSLL